MLCQVNIMTEFDSHKVYIKEEPACPNETLAAVKFEACDSFSQNESVSGSSKGHNPQVHFKVEIKEEPIWYEASSMEITCKLETPDSVLSETKPTTSEAEEALGIATPRELSGLHTESIYRNSSSDSGFSRSCGNNDPNIAKDSQYISNQSQELTLDSNSLIQNFKKQHTCEVCGSSFRFLSKLKNHKISHEGKKPHTCEICKKSYTQASTLKKHKLSHEGKKPYICDMCKKSFTLASTLKTHKLIHDGIRPHTCEICKKSFTQTSTMKQHKLTHEGKRPHACEICNKSFTLPSTLKTHKLIHEGKRPHTCEICKKSFTQLSTLTNHKLTHEGKRLHT